MTHSASESTAKAHPKPLDHNRAILWARYLIEDGDWLLLATKSTPAPVKGDEAALLVSVAVVDSNKKTLLETFIKPSGAINGDAIARHGIDASKVFSAISYEELKVRLNELFAKKQALSWSVDDQNCVFETYAAAERTAPVVVQGQSAVHQVARFDGDWNPSTGYKLPELPDSAYKSALAECHTVFDTIRKIAASNQITDSLSTGNPGWTAEFFKPKTTPVDKIKGLFGLGE